MSDDTIISPGPACTYCGEEYGQHVPFCPMLIQIVNEDIETKVCEDIRHRQEVGMTKYGVSVANNPLELKEWMQHAYTEALDLAIYLKRAMVEIEKKENL